MLRGAHGFASGGAGTLEFRGAACGVRWGADVVVSPARFELTAPGLGILCSILLSYGDPSRLILPRPQRRRNRSTAATSAVRTPGSSAEWPASGTTVSRAPGQAAASSKAVSGGQTMS